MKNKIITSEGNVQFQTVDGKIINVHPFHVYSLFNEDTVSFLLIAMPKSSGLAVFTSKAEDLEVNGVTYTFEQLPNALSEAFAIAGAQARAEIVDELPETGMTNTIYLVPKPDGQSGFDEYIYLKDEQRWELIGDTSIEFSQYLQKTDFYAYTAETETKINYISGAVDTEEARAISAETALQTAIDNEVSARTDADTALQNAINAEASARTEDVTALSGAIDTEIAAREAADSVISGAVDNVSSGLTEEAQRAQNAEGALSGAIDTKLAISDFNTYSGAVETSLNSKANSADVYTKSETDGLLADKADLSALTEDERVWGEALNDLNSRINTVSGDVANKASQSDVDSLNGVVTAHTANTTVHVTAAEKETWNGKQNALVAGENITISGNVISAQGGSSITVDTALDSGSTNPVENRVIYNKIDEVEEVTAAGLNALNDAVSGKVDTSTYSTYTAATDTALANKQTTLTAGTGIDITDNVISATGGGSITVDTALDSGSTNPVENRVIYNKIDEVEQVTARALVDVNEKFDGMRLLKITQSAYDALTTKDENTLYIIVN